MNFAASKHICKDEEMLDTLKIDGEFNHFKLENSRKIKVEGTRSVKMKLHDGTIQTFSNVRFVPSCVVNMILMWEITSQGTSMLAQSTDVRCTRVNTWCCNDRKIKVTFAIWKP